MYRKTPYKKIPAGLRPNMRRRQAIKTRARQRRAFRITLSFIVLIILVTVAAALLGVFSGPAPAAEPTNSVVNSPSPSPSESENVIPAFGETETEDEKAKEAAASVVLINFAHRYTETPKNLVKLSGVLGDLVELNTDVVYADADVANAAKKMFEAAKEDDISTFVINSAYRTPELQTELFNNRLAQDPDYGNDPYTSPVKVVPADCSEHCAGLALDILSVDHNYGSATFADTTEWKWLSENAYKYGFILRYPEDKQNITGVIYEPWHFRYVGVDVAKAVYDSGLCLEEYLTSLGLS
jgi:D-alanyl-D-alanine carboxypeptidase